MEHDTIERRGFRLLTGQTMLTWRGDVWERIAGT